MKNLLLVILVQIFLIQKCFTAAVISCHPIENSKSLFCFDDDANGCENDDDGCVVEGDCDNYDNFAYFSPGKPKLLFEKQNKKTKITTKLKDGQTDNCVIMAQGTTKIIVDAVRRILV